MSQTHSSGRHGDPAIKWLVGGTLLVLFVGVGFLSYLVDAIRFIGPSGSMAVLGMGVAACGAFGAVAFGPIGRAVGRRIIEGGAAVDPLAEAELQELRLQFEDLRNSLADTQERLDFTERMLAGGKERATEELH